MSLVVPGQEYQQPYVAAASKMAVYAKIKTAADPEAIAAMEREVMLIQHELHEVEVRAEGNAQAADAKVTSMQVTVAELEGQLVVLRDSNGWLQDQLSAERVKVDTILAAHSQKVDILKSQLPIHSTM